MGSEAGLKSWVSDKLMSLLGYSQPTVVQYVIGLSKQASSSVEVAGKLVELGLSSSGETREFAEEVYARVPRKNAGVNLYQKQEREAAMLARKQMSYQLLDADDVDDGIPVEESKLPVVSESKTSESHKKRFRRKRDDQDEDEDDEVVPSRIEDRKVKRRISNDAADDDDSESDEERLRDQREREELERHMKEKDAARTKKLTEPKLSKKEIDDAIRRSNALEQDDTRELRR